jgi:hypothetical protein
MNGQGERQGYRRDLYTDARSLVLFFESDPVSTASELETIWSKDSRVLINPSRLYPLFGFSARVVSTWRF